MRWVLFWLSAVMALAGGGLGHVPAALALEGSDFDPHAPLVEVLGACRDAAGDRAVVRVAYIAQRAHERAEIAASRARVAETRAQQQAERQMRSRIADVARHELARGAQENYGSNDGTRLRLYGRVSGSGSGVAWCANFVSYCVRRADRAHRLPANAAYVPAWRATILARERGFRPACRTSVCRGDLVIFAGARHIGIFLYWVDRAHTSFRTIEGNVGDRVAARTRSLWEVSCFGRVECSE